MRTEQLGLSFRDWLDEQRKKKLRDWCFQGVVKVKFEDNQYWQRWLKELLSPPQYLTNLLGVTDHFTGVLWKMESQSRYRNKYAPHAVAIAYVATTAFQEKAHLQLQRAVVSTIVPHVHLAPKMAFANMIKQAVRGTLKHEVTPPLYMVAAPGTIVSEWEKDATKYGHPPLGPKDKSL